MEKFNNYIEISSNDAISGTPGAFRVSLSQSIKNVQRITLELAEYCTSWYNDGELFVDEQIGGPFSLVLPNQHFVGSTLATYLQTQLTALSSGGLTYTVTFDSDQIKFTISATGNFELEFSNNDTLDVSRMLGFPDIDTGQSNSFTSTQLSVLLTPVIYLEIQNIPTNYISTNNSGVNFVLPVEEIFGSYNQINPQRSWIQTVPIKERGFNIRDLLITFKFQDGRIIDFNGCETNLVLRVDTLI